MTDPLDEIVPEPSPAALQWVRKRDGSVVAFDPARLVSSIYAARRQLDDEDAAFHAQELSQAVLHFLAAEFETRIPATDEIAELVAKVLREMSQGPTAAVYLQYRDNRRQQREKLRIIEPVVPGERSHAGAADSSASVETWDKAKIVWSLQTQADVDAATAREVAAAVERRLLACQLGRVPAGLVRELVDCELLERGLGRALFRRRTLGVAVPAIDALLARHRDPELVHRWAGRELFRQYALQEVYSPDVAGLHEEGLIHLYGAAAPGHWAGAGLSTLAIAGRSSDNTSFLRAFDVALGDLARRVDGTIAIDAIDGVLALIADDGTDPAALANQVGDVLERAVRGSANALVVNLFGRVPPLVSADFSEGPLFRVRPDELQDRLAARLATALAERIFRDPLLASRCVVDIHPDLHADPEDLSLLLAPWARWPLRNGRIRFAFDRETTHLAEGLSWSAAGRTAVYQYVGLRLPLLYRRLGKGTDDETLMERVGLLCDSAVRAGVQKREFLRRQQPDSFADRTGVEPVMVVVPIGLDAVVAELLGKPIAADEASTAFAEQLVAHMLHRLRREGRHYQVHAVVDGVLAPEGENATSDFDPVAAPGVTPALEADRPRRQIAAGGRLHATTRTGVTFCRLATHDPGQLEALVELLHFAASQTSTCRLQFVLPSPARQASLVEDWLRR